MGRLLVLMSKTGELHITTSYKTKLDPQFILIPKVIVQMNLFTCKIVHLTLPK